MRFVCAFAVCVSFIALAQDAPKTVEATPPSASQAASKEAALEPLSEDVLQGMENYWAEEEAGESPPSALSLDVRTCVEMTLSQNAQVLVAQDDVDAAKAKIGQARSQLLPQVKGKIAYAYIDDLGFKSSGGFFGDIIASLFSGMTGNKEQRQDTITINQTLFTGGQIVAAIKASKYLAESQEWQRQTKLDGLEFDAKQAYYTCLLARAMVRVADESVATFKRHLADAQQMLDVGLISNFEVLRAKTEVGAREADLVAGKNAVRLSIENLRRVLALPEDKPIRLTGKLEWTPISEAADDLVAQALENRPEILSLQKGISAAEQNVRRVKGQFLPKVGAMAEWANIDGAGQTTPEGWTLGVGAELEIFAGGRRIHEVAEAKAQQRSLEHQLEDVRRLIEFDVRNAYIQMEDAMARVQQEQGTVELGREGRRLAQLRFQEGVGTQTETLDAELALRNAETLLVKAIHDYAVAHASIEKAIGKSWVAKEESSAK